MAISPLKQKKIMITRDEKHSKDVAKKIEALGGEPVIVPLIDFLPATLKNEEKLILRCLKEYDWLVFTSSNGVHFFIHHLQHLRLDSSLIKAKIAVVGDKTKRAVMEQGLVPSLLPEDYMAEGLVHAFQSEHIRGKNILYIKGNLARDVIPAELKKLGSKVTELVVYHTICPSPKELLIEVLEHGVDAITFTSPSTIDHFVNLLNGTQWRKWIQDTLICCIGPITHEKAIEYDLKPGLTPSTYTMDHLLAELAVYFQK